MLCVSIREGEYVMIGDSIKVHFNRTKSKDLILGIEAPREINISRSKAYEDGIERMAEEGNQEAQGLSMRLKEEHAERRQRYDSRRTRNAKPGQRVAVS